MTSETGPRLKLRAPALRQLATDFEAEVFDLLEGLEFYPVAVSHTDEHFSGYRILELGESRVTVSVKTSKRNLKRS